tara:strand:+ start:169 stop:702 length:534 start_codon:yes stop_codon:yes gene_type:complete
MASSSNDIIDIFTDGSEIKENKTYKTLGLGWAYIIKINKETVHFENGSIDEGNNQRVELYAIYKALSYITNNFLVSSQDITIHSDSEYSIKSLNLWCLKWVKNNWMKADKTKVKHRDIIEPSLELIKNIKKTHCNLMFNHVRSHTNKKDFIHSGNQEADNLATMASKSNMKRNKCDC